MSYDLLLLSTYEYFWDISIYVYSKLKPILSFFTIFCTLPLSLSISLVNMIGKSIETSCCFQILEYQIDWEHWKRLRKSVISFLTLAIGQPNYLSFNSDFSECCLFRCLRKGLLLLYMKQKGTFCKVLRNTIPYRKLLCPFVQNYSETTNHTE